MCNSHEQKEKRKAYSKKIKLFQKEAWFMCLTFFVCLAQGAGTRSH